MIAGLILLFVAVLAGIGAFFGKKVFENYKEIQRARVSKHVIDTKSFRKGIVKNSVIGGVCFLVVLFGMLIGPVGLYQVNAHEVAIVKTFGKIDGQPRTAGLYWRNVFTQTKTIYDLRVKQEVITYSTYSKEMLGVTVTVAVQYEFQAENVGKFAQQFGTSGVIQSRIENDIRNAVDLASKEIEIEQYVASQGMLNVQVKESLYDSFNTYYLNVVRVTVSNPVIPLEIENMIEASKRAEQEKNLANAKLAIAEIERELIRINAQAEADAITILMEIWNDITPEVRELMLRQMAIEKWDGKMPDTVVGTEFFEMLFGAFINP